jgi:ligand-binding sensor domain-containing protein
MQLLLKIKWALGAASCGLALALCGGFVFWKASSALHRATKQVAEEAEIPFTSFRLDRTFPIRVEWISAPDVFNDVRFFRGHLYLCGPSGLFVFDPNGKVVARYRVGLEMPSAPPVSLAAGVARDEGEPELFVATAGGGLLAFNENTFHQVLPNDASYRDLTAVLPLSTGRILLGTSKKGVLVYDGQHISRFHSTLSDLHVTSLAGSESSLWVGTLDRGVLHWHAGQVDRFSEAEGLPDPQVLSLAVEGERAYVGTPLGVGEFLDGRFNRVLASAYFARSLLLHNETLFVGTMEEGTLEVPLSASPNRPSRLRGQELPSAVQRLLDHEGTLYALAEDGLYSLNRHADGWRRVVARENALLADRNVSALAVDPAGRLWVGYFDRGLDIIEPGGERATHIETEHVFCINRIVYDPQHNDALVATANGLVIFDSAGRQRQVLGRPEGLVADHVTDVTLGPAGMTVATPAGLTFVTASGTRSLYAFHGLVNNHIYAMASTGDRLMVGTLGGLSVVDSGQVKASYTTSNSGLKHNWITAIVSVGDDWFVGTYGAGILRLDTTGRWQIFSDAAGEFNVNPNAMVATDSRVYAGTLGQGLYVYDRTAARWTAVNAGLPSNNVTAVAARGGYLYVGTDNGLIRIPEQDLATR